MRHRASALAALAIVLPAAVAAHPAPVTIAPTTLDRALIELSRQTGSDVISTEPGLRAIATRAVTAGSLDEALARLLKGTGYHAVRTAGGVRVVRDSPSIVRLATAPRPERRARPRSDAATTSPDEVLVTASKQRLPLLRYPGSLTVIGGQTIPDPNQANLSDLAAQQPILQTTALGPGRNKIFIRGVADSSFNGATESTASIYLDDVQLGYSGTDPGLKLYDMREIDVLEGPQGTLYGSGAIGGIVRMVSNPVDLERFGGSLAGGVTLTAGGGPGGEVSGVANAPIVAGRLGLRLVGYRSVEGGYIDDVGRGLNDVNRVDTMGGRGSLLFDAGDDWTVTVAGLAQQIESRDAQYADASVGPLARRSLIAEPFSNGVRSGHLLVEKHWDSGLELLSATGAVWTNSFDRFDSSAVSPVQGQVRSYQTNGDKLLLSHEMRLSRSLADGNSWVIGFSLLRDTDAIARSVTTPGEDVSIIGVTNRTQSASLFAEGTKPVLANFFVTLGARLTAARTDGDPSATPRGGSFVNGRSTRRIDPTAAFSWRFAPSWAMFARYQSGYRTGGLAVAAGVGRVADFRSDSIQMVEVGVRKVRSGTTGLAASASLSIADWHNIQADLINRRGQPYTDNLGDARLQSAEAAIDWVPIARLHLTSSLFFTHNRVTGDMAALSRANNRRLPETPAIAGHGGVLYEWPTAGGAVLRAGASASYVGPSVLGVGDLLDVHQGNYTTGELTAGARWGRYDLSALVDNVTDTTGNRFAYGNPFILANRAESTPLRPINVSLRLAVSW